MSDVAMGMQLPAERRRGARPRCAASRGVRALTLVEVLAVLVILGLIAATLVVSFAGVFGTAKHELTRTGIGVVVGKLEIYRMARNGYPATDVGLDALTEGKAVPGDAFFLMPDQLLDPWGRKYLYVSPGPGGHPFEVASYGADGQPGGEGENADVSSTALRRKEGS